MPKSFETVEQLLADVAYFGAETLPFEIYEANTGKKLRAVDSYLEDGIFCLDVEEAE